MVFVRGSYSAFKDGAGALIGDSSLIQMKPTRIKLVGRLVFVEKGKPEYRAENLSGQRLNPHMTSRLGVESRSHWWEVSTLTTASSLLLLTEADFVSVLFVAVSWL